MEKITALPFRFLNYISPTRQRMRTPQTDTASQGEHQIRRQSTSPLARLLNWNMKTKPDPVPLPLSKKRPRTNLEGSDSLSSETRKAKKSKLSSPDPSDEPRAASEHEEEPEDSFISGEASENSVISEEPTENSVTSEEQVEYDDSIEGEVNKSEIAEQTGSTFSDPTSEWDNVLDEHGESVVVSKPQKYSLPTPAVYERELARRAKETAALSTAGWSPSNVLLFRKLAMRGFEPLMPWEWSEREFLAFPTALFTKDDKDTFITGINRDGYLGPHRATKALNVLLDLGDRVRAKQLIKLDPGQWIKQKISAYVNWSLRDAALLKKVGYPQMLAIQVAGASQSGYDLQVRMVKRLRKLTQQWQKTLRRLPKDEEIKQCPSVYGIIISQTVLAFVGYVPKTVKDEGDAITDPASELHTIGLFDYSDGGYDVWNTLAVAILVIHCRNQLVELVEAAPSILTGDKLEPADPDL